MNKQTEAIDKALTELQSACGLGRSESSTEILFGILYNAAAEVAKNWKIVEDSHRDGLCFNVNALLTDAIIRELSEQEIPKTNKRK